MDEHLTDTQSCRLTLLLLDVGKAQTNRNYARFFIEILKKTILFRTFFLFQMIFQFNRYNENMDILKRKIFTAVKQHKKI